MVCWACLLAKGAAPGLANALPGMTFYLAPQQLAAGLALALLVGVLAGALPALVGDAAAGGRRAAEGVTMAIPLTYNLRSVRQRWASAIVAVLGIAGTVAVFVAMMALAQGFRATLVASGLAVERHRAARRGRRPR